ncbi:hypothetical protein ABZP36_003876 [Zizania latifolia]
MKGAVCALFDLPDDTKRRNTDINTGSGYVTPSPTNLLYEAFGLCATAAFVDVDAFYARLDAPPHVRETMNVYVERMHELIVDVTGKVADWPCQFRMNRYNYTQDSVGSLGVQIHTDTGFLTVLQENECVGGLEVLDPIAGEFVPVDPLPGSFVINIGDVGTAWSNGRLHNVKHRVQCVATVPRISIAMFLLAPKDDGVSVSEEMVDAEHPRRFREFNYDDYRRLWLSTG